MPSLVRIRVESARDLPIMDRNLQGDENTDSYVEVKLGDENQYTYRTETCRKTLNPVWKEEFTFELVYDSILQNSPLEFKVMDQDLYSSEQIGTVLVDLSPLIMRTANGSDRDLVIQGWLPIYDTSRRVHGSLKVFVKLQFITDDNPFRGSSAGVQFFSASVLSPNVFLVQEVIGFVADLVVEEDPELSWQDYFRRAKTPNDIRMKVLYNLTAKVRREIGKKVLDVGGNAVLGYNSHFDIEGVSGIVARAYGTACRIIKVSDLAALTPGVDMDRAAADGSNAAIGGGTPAVTGPSILPPDKAKKERDGANQVVGASMYAMNVYSRMGSLVDFGASAGNELEVQIFSSKAFDSLVRVRLGGLVMAHSVKFLGKLESTLSDQETREGWWEELRHEMKSHAKTCCCTHIIGYSETCTLSGDVCILSAVGTAAIVKQMPYHPLFQSPPIESVPLFGSASPGSLTSPTYGIPSSLSNDLRNEIPTSASANADSGRITPGRASCAAPTEKELRSGGPQSTSRPLRYASLQGLEPTTVRPPRPCNSAHVPYNHNRAPFDFMRLVPCLVCRRKWVPETILSTTEPAENLPIRGKGELLEARAVRSRRPATGEVDAVNISGFLAFFEFELQRQVILKLKILGMNAVFGYTSKIQLGSNIVVATVTATAFYVEALPPPPVLHVNRTIKETSEDRDGRLSKMQSQIETLCLANKSALEALSPAQLKAESDMTAEAANPSAESDERGGERGEYSSSSSSSSSSTDDGDDSSLESPTDSDDDDKEEDSDEEEGKQEATSPREEAQGRSRVGLDTSQSALRIGRSARLPQPHPRKRAGRMVYVDERRPFVFEVEEETDVDMMAVLMERALPPGISIVNTQYVKGSADKVDGNGLRHVTVQCRVKLPVLGKAHASSGAGGVSLNQHLTKLFQDVYARLCFSLRNMQPCHVLGLNHTVSIVEEQALEILLSAMVHKVKLASAAVSPSTALCPPLLSPSFLGLVTSSGNLKHSVSSRLDLTSPSPSPSMNPSRDSLGASGALRASDGMGVRVLLSPLSYLPGTRVRRYLGPVQLHFVRESLTVRGEGSLESFFATFIAEVNASARAHVFALGGNALLGYQLVQQIYRNQVTGYMLSVTGDAVHVESTTLSSARTPSMDDWLLHSERHGSVDSQPSERHSQSLETLSSLRTPHVPKSRSSSMYE